MTGPTRRAVVEGAVLALAGCLPAGDDSAAPPSCASPDDPVPGGAYIGDIPFLEPDTAGSETLHGAGLDARQTWGLDQLTGATLDVPNTGFFVRTAASTLLDLDQDWTIQVTGLVEATTLRLADLLPEAVDQGPVLLECSGNTRSAAFGLMSSARWKGIPLAPVLARLVVDPSATRVRIAGFDTYPTESTSSTPGCDWIFTFADLAGAFLAVEMNGEALPLDHGYPVRLIVPGWYGCCNVKWVNLIEFVDEDAPATAHMQEFAVRTEQTDIWERARDFAPAIMAQAALPVRVEMWRVGERMAYRIVGILWGGTVPTDKLVIGFNGGPKVPVDSCPRPTTNTTWTLWSHLWFPEFVGDVTIELAIDDPSIPTPRLDNGWYLRAVHIPET